MFAPSVSPYDTNEWFVASDRGGLFHTKNSGGRWDPVHFQELQANRETHVQFASVSNVLYALDCTPTGGVEVTRAARSVDGGQTWSPLANDPTAGHAYTLYADPDTTNRILVSSYSAIYLSTDYGVTFSQKYAYGAGSNGCRVGGVYFDGANIFVGCNAGLLVSTDGGATFGLAGLGIPAGEESSLWRAPGRA